MRDSVTVSATGGRERSLARSWWPDMAFGRTKLDEDSHTQKGLQMPVNGVLVNVKDYLLPSNHRSISWTAAEYLRISSLFRKACRPEYAVSVQP